MENFTRFGVNLTPWVYGRARQPGGDQDLMMRGVDEVEDVKQQAHNQQKSDAEGQP